VVSATLSGAGHRVLVREEHAIPGADEFIARLRSIGTA
jgi:hypothetical protein